MRNKSISSLKKKLDRVFSIWIRKRDADDNGYASCCTCGKTDHYTGMDAGHFRSRRNNSTRYDEKNVATQCRYCNRYDSGCQYEFGKYIDERWGEGTADELTRLSRQTKKWTVSELEELIKKYE